VLIAFTAFGLLSPSIYSRGSTEILAGIVLPLQTGAAVAPALNASTAVLLLTRCYTDIMARRLDRLVSAGINAHVILDEPSDRSPLPPRQHFIDTAVVTALNVTLLTAGTTGRPVTSWERALVFCWLQGYASCWFIEDDVRWEDPVTLRALFVAYAPDPADLVTKFQGTHEAKPWWWPWGLCDKALVALGPVETWVASYSPLCRLSRAMIRALLALAAQQGSLCFLEPIFSTVAATQGLRSSFFGIAPPPGVPRMCIRYFDEGKGLFSEER
jgi:hypothetical protein